MNQIAPSYPILTFESMAGVNLSGASLVEPTIDKLLT
jgi:hypothetical protein